MEKDQNEVPAATSGRRELKKQLADKIETALPELREILGEKKFIHRVKKAAKLLMEGLHKKQDVAQKKKQPAKKAAAKNATIAKASAKKSATKKTTTTKAATDKTATKSAKAALAKKTKATKKAGSSK